MTISYGRRIAVAFAVTVMAGVATPAGAAVERVQYRGDSYRNDSYRSDSYGDRRGGSYEDRGRGYGDQRGGDQRGGGQGREAGAPRGSYLQSCGQVQMQGATLSATCKGDRGRLFETSIDLGRCGRSDIGNNGGTLECSGTRGRSRRAD